MWRRGWPGSTALVEASADEAASRLEFGLNQQPHRLTAAVCHPLAVSPRKIERRLGVGRRSGDRRELRERARMRHRHQHGAVHPMAPFGGIKSSGIGVEFNVDGLKEYTTVQVINVASPYMDASR
jgi:hypothetical protein